MSVSVIESRYTAAMPLYESGIFSFWTPILGMTDCTGSSSVPVLRAMIRVSPPFCA